MFRRDETRTGAQRGVDFVLLGELDHAMDSRLCVTRF
jgi:hypothetical protein